MSRSHKILTTVWTTLLVAFPAWLSFAYARLECGELDENCSTGGPMPYAPIAWILLVVLVIAQAAFLRMLWRTPDQG